MEEVISKLKSKGINSFHPMKPEEILNIEMYFKIKLPCDYIKFLSMMGNGAVGFMTGSDVFGDVLLELKDWAKDVIIDNQLPELPDNSFVFWMHQGYQFAFFKLNEGDNPEVYFFTEGKGLKEFIKIENSFTDFLLKQIDFIPDVK